MRLADPPRDQLRVLRTEVDDENRVVRAGSARALTVAQAHADALLLRWSDLPSVFSAGATMTSAFWNSLTVS